MGGAPQGISDSLKENREASLLSLPCENTQKALPTKTRPPPDKQRASALTFIGLDSLQNPEHCFAFALNDPAFGISLQTLNSLRHDAYPRWRAHIEASSCFSYGSDLGPQAFLSSHLLKISLHLSLLYATKKQPELLSSEG